MNYTEEVQALRGEIKTLDSKMDCIMGAIVGLVEHPDHPGILERLRRLEARWSIATRLVWLGLGSVIAGAVTTAFVILRGG